ncbi:hypothetical protein Golax_020734 [Gossypium laxum]|uniref:Uncharacterized protein n=1 Tax=Gossypium laxum TaxID=34288 RepID=A0A7J9AJ46_9ROSI|nr:hypothetical protein [Gossypium laxum]
MIKANVCELVAIIHTVLILLHLRFTLLLPLFGAHMGIYLQLHMILMEVILFLRCQCLPLLLYQLLAVMCLFRTPKITLLAIPYLLAILERILMRKNYGAYLALNLVLSK